MDRKLGLCPFLGGSWVPIQHNVVWADACLRTKWHFDQSNRFGYNRHGPKIGVGCVPFLGDGSLSNTMWPGPRPISVVSGLLIHPAVWPQYTVRIAGAASPLFWGDGSPSKTMSPGPRPTSVPCVIFIHPAVWPQYTNVTDRQDRQDRQTDNGSIA